MHVYRTVVVAVAANMPKPGGRKIWLMANSGPNPILPDFVTFNQVDDSGNPKAVSTGRILLRIIIVALVLGLSAFLLAVGVTHVKDCPGQEEIPAYLIGVGALHVISASLQLVALLTILCWKGGLLSNISIVLEISLVRWCFGFLTMFAVVFFVFGSIYVFG